METTYEKLNEKVKKLRKEKGLTHFTLSLKADVDIDELFEFEEGGDSPSIEFCCSLARSLCIPESDLIYGYPDEEGKAIWWIKT